VPFCGRRVARDHREPDRARLVQVAGRRVRVERHEHPSDSHRRGRAGWCSPTRSHSRAASKPRSSSTTQRSRARASWPRHRALLGRVLESHRGERRLRASRRGRAASACGRSRWTMTSTRCSRATSPTSSNAPSRREGDHILAARFLQRFVPSEIPWVHVDLSAGQHKGGLAHVPSEITGSACAFTVELLRGRTPAELARGRRRERGKAKSKRMRRATRAAPNTACRGTPSEDAALGSRALPRLPARDRRRRDRRLQSGDRRAARDRGDPRRA
jgi:hypothetical protein